MMAVVTVIASLVSLPEESEDRLQDRGDMDSMGLEDGVGCRRWGHAADRVLWARCLLSGADLAVWVR